MLAGLIVGLVVFWQIFTSKSKAEESGNTETGVREPGMELEPEISMKETLENEVETEEKMEKRLKKMKNPDEGKPFAKISTPDISEIPTEAEVAPKPKKKRRYYKKSGKKPNASSEN